MIKDFKPVAIRTDGPAVDEDRVEIFSIDDVPYTAPRRVPGGLAWRALGIAAEQGNAAAANFMAVEALGEKAMDALSECRHVDSEQLGRIVTGLAQAYWGDLQEALSGLGKERQNATGA